MLFYEPEKDSDEIILISFTWNKKKIVNEISLFTYHGKIGDKPYGYPPKIVHIGPEVEVPR